MADEPILGGMYSDPAADAQPEGTDMFGITPEMRRVMAAQQAAYNRALAEGRMPGVSEVISAGHRAMFGDGLNFGGQPAAAATHSPPVVRAAPMPAADPMAGLRTLQSRMSILSIMQMAILNAERTSASEERANVVDQARRYAEAALSALEKAGLAVWPSNGSPA